MDWASLLDGAGVFGAKLLALAGITAFAAILVLGFEQVTSRIHWNHHWGHRRHRV